MRNWKVEFVEDAWETTQQYKGIGYGLTNALLMAILKVLLVILVRMEKEHV